MKSSFWKGSYVKSAAILSIGGFLAKGIGAVYRVFLSALLGGYGTGLYQMAYPLYCVLLTFSSAGIPSAFSRVLAGEIAAGRDGRETAGTALRLFALLGLAGTLGMLLLAPVMSEWQGRSDLLFCYLALAPSVFFVALIAVLRGYFQGKNEMAPTACSEICEQLFKAGLGIAFALNMRGDPVRAVYLSLAAVTLSELAALLFLWRRYTGEPRRPFLKTGRSPSRILLSALPVMASASLLPLSQMADSVLLVRLLGGDARAVTLYGMFAGGVHALVGLPASVCFGLAAASVPAVASAWAKGEREEGREHALRALLLTLALSSLAALGLFLFAGPVSRILYRSLGDDLPLFISLLRLSALSSCLLAGMNTLSACLTGMGRAKRAAANVLLSVLVKHILQLLLVPAFSVFGAAIASNVCYLLAFSLDLVYTVRKAKERQRDHDCKFGDGEGRPDGAGTSRAQRGGRGTRAHGANAVARRA